jgi:hypothetical protein
MVKITIVMDRKTFIWAVAIITAAVLSATR